MVVACAGGWWLTVLRKTVEALGDQEDWVLAALTSRSRLPLIAPAHEYLGVLPEGDTPALSLASRAMGPQTLCLCQGVPVSYLTALEGALDARALRLLARAPAELPSEFLATLYLRRMVEQGSSLERSLASMVFRACRGEGRLVAALLASHFELQRPRSRLLVAVRGHGYCIAFFESLCNTACVAPCAALERLSPSYVRPLENTIVRITLRGEGVPRVEFLDPKALLRA